MSASPRPAVTDARARAGPAVRVLDTVAGLLSAGVLVVGVLLLVAAVIAPSALSAAGLGGATGPGWGRVIAQLAVGVVGELVVRFRGTWRTAVRAVADAAVIVAVPTVIAWAWWP